MMSEENVRLSGEDYGVYYARLLGASYRASEAVKIHETWKRRLMMGSGVREVDCKQTAWVLAGLMSWLRNRDDGPHFFQWQRDFLNSEEDAKIRLILTAENHRTDEEIFALMKERWQA